MGLERFREAQVLNTPELRVGTGAGMFQLMKFQCQMVHHWSIQAHLEGPKVCHVRVGFHMTKLLAGIGLATSQERIFPAQTQAHLKNPGSRAHQTRCHDKQGLESTPMLQDGIGREMCPTKM